MHEGHGRGPGSSGGSSSGWKAGDVVADQFPAGLRVLVVDDDPTCLVILEKMLRTCLYEVTKCNRAEIALSLLRKNKSGFDIVISDVHMPDMDGFKLLEQVGLEMDLPVIMMSADESKNVVMKGVTHGACDYLIKPVRMEALKNIWQHVVRKRRNEWNIPEHSGSIEEGGSQQKLPNEEDNNSSSVNEGNDNNNWRNTKRRKDEAGDEEDEKEDTSNLKKPRVVWSVELHQQFVGAVNQLGVDKAVPKKILELMNVPGLTRENVASHLQKYRIYLRRLGGVSQHQGNLNNSFITQQEANFGPLSSLNGFDLQALAVAGQLPTQSLAQLQAAGLGRPAAPKPGVPVSPLVDQRNIFSFENPKIRFGEGQTQPQQHMNGGSSVNNKQMNLLHGIPMEPKQLVGMQPIGSGGMTMQIVGSRGGQIGQSGSMLMPVGQQPRGQISPCMVLPNNASGRISGIPDIVSGRNAIIGQSSRGVPSYNSVTQQTNPMFNHFPLNQNPELPGDSFPPASAPGISIPASKGVPYQEEVNSSDIKVSAGFVPSYDIFNDLQQHNKPQDWDLHTVGLAFDAPQHPQGNLEATPVFSASEGYSPSTQRNGQSVNALAGEGTGHGNVQQNMGQHLNSVYVDNSTRVKSESISESGCPATLFQEQYNQEDLMSALLKQEGIPPAENEFDFDGYSLDNIPV